MNKKVLGSESRRSFVKKSALAASASLSGNLLPGISAASYRRIMGANEMIRVSVMGVNSRGLALAQNFAFHQDCEVIGICDVDQRAIDKCLNGIKDIQESTPLRYTDFRKSLENKEVDALVIAAPDHWHAPAALLGLKAGKHIYIEKPCSHNPHEGELLIQATAKYKKSMQMGNQRRSWPNVMQAIQDIKEGAIGRPYFGKGWYTNNRASIGIGKETAVPEWLDWNLWQGPAPRRKFKDNLVHYNWHWLWHWGTGESCNNGTHMIDLLRWGLNVDYPTKVSSNGGRYHYKDDWETPDTQVINIDFKEGVSMSWEGRSCNGKYIEGSSVGVAFYGEKGTLVIYGGNEYKIYDLKNNVIKEVKDEKGVDPRDLANPAGHLDATHVRNFFDNIKLNTPLRSDIDSGHKSTLLMQLGNISQRVGRSLNINPQNGHILGDTLANMHWKREYEKGWEMKL